MPQVYDGEGFSIPTATEAQNLVTLASNAAQHLDLRVWMVANTAK
jgi:hypothetical protein